MPRNDHGTSILTADWMEKIQYQKFLPNQKNDLIRSGTGPLKEFSQCLLIIK